MSNTSTVNPAEEHKQQAIDSSIDKVQVPSSPSMGGSSDADDALANLNDPFVNFNAQIRRTRQLDGDNTVPYGSVDDDSEFSKSEKAG